MALHVGDEGTRIRLTVKDEDGVAVNLSSPLSLEALLTKPDGTVVVKTAALVSGGADGRIQYVTAAGDLDVAGTWYVRARVRTAEGRWTSDSIRVEVAP